MAATPKTIFVGYVGSYGFGLSYEMPTVLTDTSALTAYIGRPDDTVVEHTLGDGVEIVDVDGTTVLVTIQEGDLTVKGTYTLHVCDDTPGRKVIGGAAKFSVKESIVP